MNRTTTILVGAIVLAVPSHLPAHAGSREIPSLVTAFPTDLSSARKHRRVHVRVTKRAPARATRPPQHWWADPSFGPYQSLWDAQKTGRCVEDLGYGRWRHCDWD